jgi:hypothetical protein
MGERVVGADDLKGGDGSGGGGGGDDSFVGLVQSANLFDIMMACLFVFRWNVSHFLSAHISPDPTALI